MNIYGIASWGSGADDSGAVQNDSCPIHFLTKKKPLTYLDLGGPEDDTAGLWDRYCVYYNLNAFCSSAAVIALSPRQERGHGRVFVPVSQRSTVKEFPFR